MTEKKMKINWMNTSFLTAMPVFAVAGVIYYIYNFGIHWSDIAILVFMYMATGLGVTGGYHRCFSHRAYECHPIIQFFLLIFGAAALENSTLCWSADHRRHHRHVDHDEDPYNINKGFFWAHMGWIFFDNRDEYGDRFDNVEDLKKNKLVMWQHKYYLTIAIAVGFGLPMLISGFFGRPMAGLIWGGLIRQVLTHHSTFLINSAAHVFGKRPFSTENTARDSWWLAFFSFGEGYHNFHHAFPSDYRNGIKWYHWDPTKWMIRSLSYAKLSWGLRKTPRQTIHGAMERVKEAINNTHVTREMKHE